MPNSLRLKQMQTDLVFRGTHQKCAHNAKEISNFAAQLVFRHVPGKSVQRRGHSQRLRLSFLHTALLDTIAGGIVRVLRPPLSLSLLPSRRLALRLTTCPLTHSDPRMGTEPAAADGTGSLPGSGHRDSSSLRPYPPVGHSNQVRRVIFGERRWESLRERRSCRPSSPFARFEQCVIRGQEEGPNPLLASACRVRTSSQSISWNNSTSWSRAAA